MELRMRLVWRSIASVTTAGEGGSGMLSTKLEDLRATSLLGVLIRAPKEPSASALAGISKGHNSRFVGATYALSSGDTVFRRGFFAGGASSSDLTISVTLSAIFLAGGRELDPNRL